MRRVRLVLPALLGLFLIAVAVVLVVREPADGAEPSPRSAQAPQQSATEHLRVLATIAQRNGGNRALATPGDRATYDYIARTLTRAGYRVSTPAVEVPSFRERSRPALRAGNRTLRARTLLFSGSGRATGTVQRIARLGCDQADYESLQRGEVAVVARGTCTLRSKALNAQRAGAEAIVVVNSQNAPFPGTLASPGVRIPALTVGRAAGSSLRAGARVTLRVDASTKVQRTRNVIAEIPSGDPNRVVMAGAHLDSVPAGPGINDNATGVAALLETAQKLTTQPPAAKVRFGFWGAEEVGLVGSRAYVASLPRTAHQQIAAYINLDMVGSPNPVPSVYGDDDRITGALREAIDASGARPEGVNLGGASDHASFAAADIPVGGIYTGADEDKSQPEARMHGGEAGEPRDPCYHQRCDALGNVDLPTLERMTDAAGAAIAQLAAPGGPPAR